MKIDEAESASKKGFFNLQLPTITQNYLNTDILVMVVHVWYLANHPRKIWSVDFIGSIGDYKRTQKLAVVSCLPKNSANLIQIKKKYNHEVLCRSQFLPLLLMQDLV